MFGDRILILSPHTDDGEISAGGTIAKFTEMDKQIFYVAFSSCEKSVREEFDKHVLVRECAEATRKLGIRHENLKLLNFEVREFSRDRQEILDEMIGLNRDIAPDLVITPSSFDVHQDHRVIYNEGIRAFKKTSSIIGMEHPWNNLSFSTDIFVALEERHIARKIEALSMYGSQAQRDYFNEEYIRACSYTRGMNINRKYAEVFECIRMRL